MDINEKIESYLSEAKKDKKEEKKESKKKITKSNDKVYTYAEWAKMAKQKGYVIREIKPGVFQADDGKGNTLKYDSKKVKNSLSEAFVGDGNIETLEKAYDEFVTASKKLMKVARNWNMLGLGTLEELVEDFGMDIDTLKKKINGKIK